MELIEPSPRLSNHLIATSPKLDRNTLHIKTSFLEWTTILWLKWFTCSTRSVQPLYMVNVGWVNRRWSFPPSILRVKGDLEIWFNTLLIALFPRPLRTGFYFCVYNGDSHHVKKTHREESLSQSLKESFSISRGVTSSTDSQSPTAFV